jgi:hypothetical protein
MRRMLPDQVAFIPRGVTAGLNCSVPTQGIQIRQNHEIYDSLISDMVRGGAVHLEPSRGFDDPLISQIASTIANETKGGFLDRILVDALNTALAVQIMRALSIRRRSRWRHLTGCPVSGCGACATMSRHISMRSYRLPSSPTSPV